MSELQDIAVRFQIYLEGLKTQEYADFNRVLRLLEKAVADELAKADIQDLSKEQFERVVKRVSATADRETKKALAGLLPNLKELGVASYEFEAEALQLISEVKVASAVKAAEVWGDATQRPLTATGGMLDSWLNKLTRGQVVAVEGLLRRAHAEGWTNKQIMQVMRGTRANRFTDGLSSKLGRQNSTVIRTAMQHINSVARQKVWADNEDIVKGYRWVSTLDSRTSDQCRGLDGQEFEVGKGPLPPIHPGCRSTTVAILDKKYDFLDKGATRASATGSVPQKQTYYEWLKNQPKGFQDSVIGETRGKLLRDGGLSVEEFTRLQLNSTFDPLTLDEMRKLKPLAFQRAGI